MKVLSLTTLLLLGLAPLVPGDHGDANRSEALLFDNLGAYHHRVTTASKLAQRWFDQGLILCYAFNHAEAIRSFETAAKHDPGCAMAWWGIAFAYGANINMPMPDEAVPKAYAALQKALELAPKATAKEQAYIRALSTRYADKPTKDRAPLDRAFADAMCAVAKQFPDDLDAATLFAEALMNTMPWNYWTEDGKPKPETEEVLAALERVLQRNPEHAGACHYYIHAVEASPHPERGLAAAHRLRDLVPGAGHLVHMPSHIYLRVGNYHEASLCNERAIAADEAYLARSKAKGMYPAMYYSHNIHFLWYATTMEGRSADALRAARKAAGLLKDGDMKLMPETQWMRTSPLCALVRFGRWDEIHREPQPAAEALLEMAFWHYARGTAYARQRRNEDAEREAASLEKLVHSKGVADLEKPMFPGLRLVRITHVLLQAELAGLRGQSLAHVNGLLEAALLQDKLPYMEPPYWHYPVRQALGAALLRTGQVAEAEKVYREDLRRYPENGWSLFGLLHCLREQGKAEAAADVEKRFRDAWKYADVTLTASCF